jgi:hypothetical protein
MNGPEHIVPPVTVPNLAPFACAVCLSTTSPAGDELAGEPVIRLESVI